MATVDPEARVSLLGRRYAEVRERTEALAAPLSPEDQTVQSMPDVSPTKWHRAHTTWFFETFVLPPQRPRLHGRSTRRSATSSTPTTRRSGPGSPRDQRGVISRPGVGEVADYRGHVDKAMTELFDAPRRPTRRSRWSSSACTTSSSTRSCCSWTSSTSCRATRSARHTGAGGRAAGWRCRTGSAGSTTTGGMVEIGHAGDGFGFDNEFPRHRRSLAPFALADRLGDLRRVARVHRRRRLPPARAVAVRWLGHRATSSAGRRRCTGRSEDGDVAASSPWAAPGRRPERAGVPRQLLRGRRLRPLDRAAAARPRPSGRRSRPHASPRHSRLAPPPASPDDRSPGRPLRRGVAVDGQRLQPLPRVPGRRRRGR